jgi:hypothetical protein
MPGGEATMPEKQPTIQEFEHRPSALIHIPTGATWTMLPGSTEIRSFKPSRLDMILADGDFYSEHAVRRLAVLLIMRPPPPPKEAEERMERRLRRGYHT